MVNTALSDWVKQLSEVDMPIFSGTFANVTKALNSGKSSASDVANIILQDASLTSRVLKAVNTVHFNPTKHSISTVSRAVMVMGFEQIKVLTLSMALIDNLQAGEQRTQLIQEMAFAFHAATQAREFAKHLKRNDAEDIFIATLLSRLGYMALWAFADKESQVLLNDLQKDNESTQAELKVLGFRIVDLTKALCHDWALGDLLNDYLNNRLSEKNTQLISLAIDVAESAQHGWNEAELELVAKQASSICELSIEKAKNLVLLNVNKAKELTILYGSEQISCAIQLPDYIDEHHQKTDVLDTNNHDKKLEADFDYLMKVSQEMVQALEDIPLPSINIMLEMTLEGLIRGLAMDRAIFMILNEAKTDLICKSVLGEQTEHLKQRLTITLDKNPAFSLCVEQRHAIFLSVDEAGQLSKQIQTTLGNPPHLLMPVVVKNKVIGIFMADRHQTQREISQQEFIAFQQFCQQTNMGISFLAIQG